jgi:hypothetical protein
MSDNNLRQVANENIQYLNDIKKYNETHEKDFKQVFFKPQANQIRSSQVGVFIKDIYGNEQVTPIKTIPGYHTKESCEINTAIYANSVIDYNSPTNYVPGVNQVTVEGDFANSPNYFLTGSPAVSQNVSVEISGYIAADVPGNYSVVMVHPFTKNALIWVGNNALKTYRKENSIFVVENGVKTKNLSFKMVAGEYRPFRIQYSGTPDSLDYMKLWISNDNVNITNFAKSANENNLHYYSLTPSDKTNFYKCDVYKGSDLQNYKSDAKQQVNLVWQTELPENTEYVFLDMTGNLCAYNSNYEKIVQINFPLRNVDKPVAGRYRLELYQRNLQPLYIRNRNISTPLITIANLDTIKNNEWAQTPNAMIRLMSNKDEQMGDKRVSIDKISQSKSLFSENFRYKLCIMRDKAGNKILALLASTRDTRQFYTAEPDLKMNKLFYASTYPENKFLREVPASLQTNGVGYTAAYSNSYPLTPSNFNVTDYSRTNNCAKQCDNSLGCNYFYKVTDTTGATKCLISKNSNEPITYLPKQPDSQYTSSYLKIKNKIIKTGDETKDKVYKNTMYITNGYDDTVNLSYSNYPVESKVLSNTDTPGPAGTDYVVELQNRINQRTSSAPPISLTNINKPMSAGKIENFTTVERSLTKLDEIDGQFNEYASNVYKINPNRINISNNILSINKNYVDMSGNQQKYDFTGQTIYALEEDRTLSSALLKDNAIYNEEQNNLYLVTTLTMATVLITAILVAK